MLIPKHRFLCRGGEPMSIVSILLIAAIVVIFVIAIAAEYRKK